MGLSITSPKHPRYAKRIAAGLCIECKEGEEQPLHTSVRCKVHADLKNQRNRDIYYTPKARRRSRKKVDKSIVRRFPIEDEFALNRNFISALRSFIQLRNIHLPQ
jgi:hypothetical protein